MANSGYRLGSTRAILSRSFCDNAKIENIEEIDRVFQENMKDLRDYEAYIGNISEEEFRLNKSEIAESVEMIVAKKIKLDASLYNKSEGNTLKW